MTAKQTQAHPLPGIPATIGAGFDLVTRRLWLVALPVALDVFLWLGPRLSFQPLVEQMLTQLPAEAMLVDPRPTLELIAGRTNLFTYLSVLLAGVPALMTGITPEKTPIQPQVLQLSNWGQWTALLIGLTLAGLLLTALYYTLIARAAASPETESRGSLVSHVLRSFGRLVALAAAFLLILTITILPLTIVAAFVSLLSQTLGTLVLLAVPVVMLWLLLLMSLTPGGMVLNRNSFLRALGESIRLFQLNFVSATGLLLISFGISRLMEALMLTADDGSWLTLASLIGHAFISTSLIAAAFIFYRDRYAATFITAQPQPPVENTK